MRKYLLSFLLLSNSAFAWPVFTVPSYEDIRASGQAESCQDTQHFRIKGNARIPVHSDNAWPLRAWYWTNSADSPCLPKYQPLKVEKIDISYTNDPIEFWTIYSVINAYFLAPNGQPFALQLKTPSEHWFCVHETKLKNYLTCANDTRKA